MKKQVNHAKKHEWAITILLSLVCYMLVDNFIVAMSIWKYLLIEVLLVSVIFFHMFVMKKYFPDLTLNQNDSHKGFRETYPLKDTNDPTNNEKTS